MPRLLLAWLPVLLLAAPVPAQSVARRNILFLIADDLRPELGCYGSPLARSPNIDALAASGVRFERAYCQFPLCNPSRVSMLNSRHPGTTGVLGNRTNFRVAHPDYVSLPQYFRDNGYATLRSGKVFHGGIDDPLAWTEGGDAPGRPGAGDDAPAAGKANSKRPMTQAEHSDRWIVLDDDGRSDGDYRTADRAIAYLRKYRDQPFFLACGFAKPHSPPAAPQRFYGMYDLSRIVLPPTSSLAPQCRPVFRGARSGRETPTCSSGATRCLKLRGR
jgi:arylsulfatase A-like enzyme